MITSVDPRTAAPPQTGHFKSVVTKPQNVFVMRDIACGAYVCGNNTEWFTDPTKTDPFSNAKTKIQERLNFQSDPDKKYASMLAFPMKPEQWNGGKIDNGTPHSNLNLPRAGVLTLWCAVCSHVNHLSPPLLGHHDDGTLALLPGWGSHVDHLLQQARPADDSLWR